MQSGRIYAWARDSSTHTEDNNNEAVQNVKQLKRRIRSKLSRLVLLCRAGKRHVRSHPVLAAMRHELLRIRTQLTGSLTTDGTAAMGSAHVGVLRISDWEDDCECALRRFVPSNLCSVFGRLIDQITDLFLELPAQVPGISVPTVRSQSKYEQHSRWRNVISQTVINFYNHQDTWAGIDLQVEDRIAELQASGEALSLFTSHSDSSESDDGLDKTKRSVHGLLSIKTIGNEGF
ncbi:unnamed protein product [Echinostoma caproni]|uniref:Uncharacterized protein n=1 Tax=Echinostoma caproni TaxID=27848 RepID=A0A3P8HHB2_9TREM|nr:unnamed protein product [Echinostoma caproni]